MHVLVQSDGQRVANRTNDGFVRFRVMVESIFCAKEGICFGQRQVVDCQPIPAMRGRKRRRWNLMVCKPRADKVECVRVRSDELGNLILRQVRTVSVRIRPCEQKSQKSNGMKTYFEWLGSLTSYSASIKSFSWCGLRAMRRSMVVSAGG